MRKSAVPLTDRIPNWMYWNLQLYRLAPLMRQGPLLNVGHSLQARNLNRARERIDHARPNDWTPQNFQENFSNLLNRSTVVDRWSLDLERTRQGSFYASQRVQLAARLSAKYFPGDFVEIGAWIGGTTRLLAAVAREFGRRLMVVDPWQVGTQNCDGDEYERFLENTKPFRDVIDIVRLSSLDPVAIAAMQARLLAFAYVDGLHEYDAAKSDILAVQHTRGIIAVDDVHWSQGARRAMRECAAQLGRVPVEHSFCREGYLLPPRS